MLYDYKTGERVHHANAKSAQLTKALRKAARSSHTGVVHAIFNTTSEKWDYVPEQDVSYYERNLRYKVFAVYEP